MANRLAKETSPYLLQHAHNPVDWYPWGEEALNRAKNEGKPILVSIGYSACHWCHVMERESFEDAEVAAIMNQHFVNIKIDREERPDLDHLYMDAVQAMTGSGGWPLNVFLTPGAKPFYGGTDFPPTRAFNRPAWRDVLLSMHQTFEQKRDQVEDQSVYLLEHLAKSNLLERQPREGAASTVISLSSLETAKNSLLANADRQEGGFGQAPKFPQTFLIRFLLRDYYGTGDESSMKQALLSLDKMVRGGIFDQAGGGFARYSTDERWLAPHFEKMLYDNALLVAALAEAYQLTQDPEYRRAITHTLDFVKKELTSPEGGFYSALDADSEGEEGKYYVWDAQEIRSLLGKNAELFCAFFGVTESGNWEGTNILHRPLTIDAFSAKHQLDAEETRKIMESGLHLLYEHRQLRVRPQLDDKILLGWNALMVSAYCKAYAALGEDEYRAVAVRGMGFLLERFAGEGIHFFHHSYKDSKAKVPAFLDDYASLIAALIDLQEVTGDINYLLKARDVLGYCQANFSDEKGAFFYFTHQDQQDIVLRKKEIYDGATASGNAIMAANLLNLGVVFDRSDWKARAAANVEQLGELIISHPASFGVWATLIQALAYGLDELVIMGRNLDRLRADLLARFTPFRVLQSATEENHEFPLLRKKPISGQAKIFLCRDYSCQNPVTEVDELIPLLESRKS